MSEIGLLERHGRNGRAGERGVGRGNTAMANPAAASALMRPTSLVSNATRGV